MTQNQETLFKVCEVQLVYKQTFKPSDRPKITSSEESYKVLMEIWNMEIMGFIEESKILLLNRNNRVLGYFNVSTGGICGTVVDPRVVFAAAIKACATSIIVAHNHPSGNLTPSTADIELTKRLVEGGRLLDIMVLDHIVITCEGYISFADAGLM